MVQDVRPFGSDPRPKLSAKRLTRRQREVIGLLAEGKTMKEAALLLNLTARGVAFHKYQVMRVLNLKTTADLIKFAIKSGILVS
jgi:DNA-binding CsgD family transcriptional regulator